MIKRIMESIFDPNASDEQILSSLKERKFSGISLVEYVKCEIAALRAMSVNYEGTEAGKMYANVANRLQRICNSIVEENNTTTK
jgi:hypothetical protein